METYLDRIKLLKNQQKLTNDQLAEKSGIPLGTLSKILAGMSDSPKLSNLVALCGALGCSVEYIVSGTPENTNNYTLNGEEIELIERYRRVDEWSRRLVQSVLENESLRAESATTATPALSRLTAIVSASSLRRTVPPSRAISKFTTCPSTMTGAPPSTRATATFSPPSATPLRWLF